MSDLRDSDLGTLTLFGLLPAPDLPAPDPDNDWADTDGMGPVPAGNPIALD